MSPPRVLAIDLPDHVVSRFESRIEHTVPGASDRERRFLLRMLIEAWTEGAIAERERADALRAERGRDV